ncbi:tetratricopeptide repeat protein [Wenyingzhuangia sp. 1_MG-2023]|nr:tetratricopeptide repeat protein [Wenyingzhuangia sp. 1_MG-2023]
MKNFIFGILWFTFSFVSAQDSQKLFEEANSQYQTEAYDLAIESYQNILDQGLESSEVYFNLGNSYYKTNQLAEAIYHYEKALKLDPSNKDANVNLEYANRGIIDSIKEVPKSLYEKLNKNILGIFSYNNWSKITVVTSLLAGLFWMIFFFSTQPGIKKVYFTMSIIVTLSCLTSFVITVQQYNRTKNTLFAIVFSEEVSIKNAPRDSASELFVLHEGTKLRVLDVVGDWQKIKIADGQVGWILKKFIKKL